MGVTKDTVRNWIKKTDIPAHKIGKFWKLIMSRNLRKRKTMVRIDTLS